MVKARVRLAGTQVGLSSCRLRGPNSVQSGHGRPPIGLRRLLLMLASTPLRVVNRCWSGSPCKCRDL